MNSQRFYENLVTQETNAVFLDRDHLFQRVIASVEQEKRPRRKVSVRKSFVLTVILVILLSVGCITAMAMTAIHMWGLAVEMGMDPQDLQEDSPHYGIFDRYFSIKLHGWNQEREEEGLEPFNADLIIQMVSAGDMTVEEVYQLFGRVPLPEWEYQEVQSRYGEIDQLEEEIFLESEMMENLFWQQKNGAELSSGDQKRLEEYQEKTKQLESLRQQMSQELQKKEKLYNSPSLWPKEVPAQWKVQVQEMDDIMIREVLIYIGGQLDGYGHEFIAIRPTYDLIMDAAWGSGGAENQDQHFTVRKEKVEQTIEQYFGSNVQVNHGSSGEGTKFEIQYDPQTGMYTGDANARSENRFPCILNWEQRGDEVVVQVVFLYITEQQSEGEIYYYLDENRNILGSFSSSFDGLNEYEVKKMADSLPQWEYHFRFISYYFPDENGNLTEEMAYRPIITSIERKETEKR